MNGASASFARRRAISVLPTPVGPIIMMFFGVISGRSDSTTCWRRQRLRRAIATARLAAFWPTMCLSSSSTISRGVICDMGRQFLDRQIAVRVDADVRSDIERSFDDVAGGQVPLHEGQGGGLCEAPTRTNRDQVVLRFNDVAIARDDIHVLGVRDTQQCLEPAQASIGTPILGKFNGGAGQVAVFLEFSLEALKQSEGIGGAACEAGKHLVAVQPAHLACVALHHALAQGDLSIATDCDPPMAPHGENSGAVDSLWIVVHYA